MNWNSLTQEEQLQAIMEESQQVPVVIFKHSTTCSISATAKNRFERQWEADAEKAKPYYLDLHAHRAISNKIAELFGIRHESPQVLLIRNGSCIYHASHLGINAPAVMAQLAA